ncbi:MAG: sulfotransferase [Flavobacteriaceae bacterium]|nr:sulfotransferase [Flavobacteriaceae bacterium]
MKNTVFIIGLPRSGTSFLGNKLKCIEDSVYLEEPNHAWMYRNMHKGHDCLDDTDLTERKRAFLHKFFLDRPAQTIIEKTPSNCLRLRYINAAFPNSKYIYITRSPEDIKNSIFRKWTKEEDNNNHIIYKGNSSQRLRQFKIQVNKLISTPLVDLPYYLPKIKQELLFLAGRSRSYWGPRIPGYHQLISKYSVEEIIEKQVNYCIEKVESDLLTLPSSNIYNITFNELERCPDDTLISIREFLF